MGSSKKERRVRLIEEILKLRLLDDIFMKAVLQGNLQAVQDIVRVILQREDITVLSVHTQDEFSNLVGHGVRLDVLAVDAEGKYYNIEINRDNDDDLPQRARYNMGAVDWHTFPAGENYRDLAQVWIIFITESDPYGRGLPLYHVERYVTETMEPFGDAGHIIFANGAYVGDDPVGLLMADFRETDPKKMHYRSLGDKAQEFKHTERGLTAMCRFAEELREEGIRLGERKGREEGIRLGERKGREEERLRTISALVMGLPEEELLNNQAFCYLNVTREEIEQAKQRFGGAP